MPYNSQQIAKITAGKILNANPIPAAITQLLLDSRQLIFPEASLFFAFTGKRNDGHEFIPKLYKSGVRNFIVTKKIKTAQYPEANFILVKNMVQSLQAIVTFHRKQFQLKTIAITGSNGKTIVKEWLFQLLENDYTLVRSPKSYNSQIGVPLSVWQIKPEDEMGIFEAGISQVGEMEKLAPIIRPDIGIFTNIGDAHSKGFASLQEKIREKLKLFKDPDCIIYCKDHQEIDRLVHEVYPTKKRFCWSKKMDADLRIKSTQQGKKQTTFSFFYKNKTTEIVLPFTDDASQENALHCLSTLCYLNYNPEVIKERIARLESVAMRLELKDGINNCMLINDSYNSDFSSINIALNFLEQQSFGKKKSIIISDILQSGRKKEALYEKLGMLLSGKDLFRVITVGKDIKRLEKYLSDHIVFHYYKNTKNLLTELDFDAIQNEVILIKGARKFAFEKITTTLSRKIHNTVLEINLNALLHNLNVYTARLKPETKMMVMVKASAYGSGSIEVAQLLEDHHVDYLAVAYADEGVELRKAGIKTPILVLNPEEAVFETMYRYQLEPEIYSNQLLKKFIRQLPPESPPYPIHLKLDTGLKRLGFEAEDLPELIQILQSSPQILVHSIFSHLAGSDNPQHDDFTNIQAKVFHNLCVELCGKLGYQPLRHLLNSGGILRFPQYQLEMVRLGIGLYGIDGSGLVNQELKPVLSLKASISQLKMVAPEETIGYNRHGKAAKPMKIATISIGYADGLMRKAGNGQFEVFLRGEMASIVGDVCMDMCMIDVSDIPDVREGDVVELFGENVPVGKLASACGTIAYEVFTGISERVRRVYVQE